MLVWLVPLILWTIVARSAAPMRHKFTLLVALIMAVAFMLPYYSQATGLSSPASRTIQEVIIAPLPETELQAAPEADQQAAPQTAPQKNPE